MDDHDPIHPSHRCPDCGGSIKRVLRSENDKRRWDADRWHRYRCRNEHCDWQGLLAVTERLRQPATRPRGPSVLARVGRTMVYWLLAVGLAWASLQALQELIDG